MDYALALLVGLGVGVLLTRLAARPDLTEQQAQDQINAVTARLKRANDALTHLVNTHRKGH